MTAPGTSTGTGIHTSTSTADKRRAFRQLHEAGCFVIPNPWDIGSARLLQGFGFKALATTSSGFAWSRGHPDNGVTRDMALAHLHEIVAATDVPVNADFERGFAPDAAGVAQSVRLAIETGVAGLSIEDSTGDMAQPLYALDEACKRMRAARSAIDKMGGDVMLVGRAECFNFLVGAAIKMTVADIAALGVRRISVGGAMARAAWGGFMRAAKLLAEQGRFDGFADAAAGQELSAFFADDLKRRPAR